MRLLSVSTFVLCVAAIASLSAQQSPMRPGRWQVTMQMQMPGMPMAMPAMTTNQCITQQMLEKDPTSGLPRGTQDPKSECKVSDHKVSGNTVTWKMACAGAQPMTGEGEMTFAQDSYTGTMRMNMAQGDMTMKLGGKRTGDCTQ